jgi:hypothetical protein
LRRYVSNSRFTAPLFRSVNQYGLKESGHQPTS